MELAVATPVQLGLPGALTETAWIPPTDMSKEQWQHAGQALAFIAKGHAWWIGDWWNYGVEKYSQTREETERLVGADYQTVRDAGWVAARFNVSRRRDTLTFSHHRDVAALDEGEQDYWLERAADEAWTREELRAHVRTDRLVDRHVAAGMLPPGQFDVLYADPPWQYEFPISDTRRIENHYETMPAEAIGLLEIDGRGVPEIAAPNATLFLWATNPKLTEALAVLAAWDFTYRSNIVWVKDRIGMGHLTRGQHELLLIGRRGEHPMPLSVETSVLDAPRTEHSSKPPAVYELIERMYPEARRLELFSRCLRPEWESWGNDPALVL